MQNAKVVDTSIGRGEIEGRALWGNIVFRIYPNNRINSAG